MLSLISIYWYLLSLYSLIKTLSRLYNFDMADELKYKLGRNIKVERIRKNITQEQFAELIDMSLSYVSKLEQGLTSPTAIALFKMAKILNIPMGKFFEGIEL